MKRYIGRHTVQALLTVILMYVIGTVLIAASPIAADKAVRWSPLAAWGASWETGQPVANRIVTAAGPSLLLFFLGTAVSFLLGVPLGVGSAITDRENRWFQAAFTVLSAIPALVAGFVLIRLLAVEIPLFPLSGIESLSGAISRSSGATRNGPAQIADVLYHSILPALVIALADGNLMDVTHGAAAAVHTHRHMGYLEALDLIGMSRSRVIGRYFSRSALVSAVSAFRFRIPMLFGGLVVVEQVFSIPGLGNLFVRAMEYNDIPVLRALVVVLSLATGAAYLLSAFSVVLVDPTVRTEGVECAAS